jgi:hypothetical protein
MGKRPGRLYALLPVPWLALFACARSELWGGVTFEEPEPGDAASFEAGGADVVHDSVSADRDAPDAPPDSMPDATPDAVAEEAPPPQEAGDSSDEDQAPVLPAPRLLSPLSTATVTSQTPLLRWSLAAGEDGAAVDVCRDRACTTLVTTFQVAGSSATPPEALSQGVYFWRVRGAAGGTLGTSYSRVWEFFVGARGAPRNVSWGTVPDVNGDGFADLVTTAPGTTGKPGYLFAYLGGVQGVSTSPATFSLGNEYDSFTNDPVASAGDVNGDGFADVIVGVPHVNGPSASFYLFSGGPDGLEPIPSVVVGPPGAAGQFGWVVSSAGDVDGDGYADFVVCTTVAPNGCFLYHGGEGALSTVPWATLSSVTLPNGATGNYGISAASAGDIDGDGYGDLVFGITYPGKYVAVHTGSAAGLSPTPVFLLAPHIPDPIDDDPAFGSSLACAGDVNGDGFADVIIGSPGDGNGYDSTGSTYLYLGSANGLSSAPLALDRPTPNTGAAFGAAVSGAGDVDGDGYGDLLAATETQGYFFFGGPAGPSRAAIALPGGQAYFGGQGAIAGGGDVNGDGFAEVLLGAPDGNGYLGGVLVYPGSGSGPTTPWNLTGPSGASFFGASVARLEVRPAKRVRLL